MSSSDYTTTPNLGLFMPNYDMDDGTWGFHLNSNASVLDSAVHALQGSTAGGPFLPLTGGTVTGHLTGTTSAELVRFNMTAVGSGVNGPATGQFGLTITGIKDNWNSLPVTAAVGEIDGLNIFVRQGGPGSDCGGILVNAQNTGTGFLAGHEYASSVVSLSTSLYTYYIDSQEAVHDGIGNNHYGHVYTAAVGACTAGILMQSAPLATYTSSWTNFLTCIQNGVTAFNVDGNGNVVTYGNLQANGSGVLLVQGHTNTTAASASYLMWNKTNGDGMTWLLNQKGGGSGGFQIGQVDASGNVTHSIYIDNLGNINAPAGVGFNGSAAPAKPTGWGAATGTATRSTFLTSSVTLPTLAEHVKALIDDLTSYGLIGP